MARPFGLVVVTSLLVVLPLVSVAQTPPKPPPRLPPTPSQTSQIPSGVDTGTPATSDSLPLGTPVMSQAVGERSGRGTSAAARAAARPKPTASSTDCTKPLPPETGDSKGTMAPLPKATITGNAKAPVKTPVAPGATRIDC